MIDKLRRDIYVYQGTNCDFTFDINVLGERYSLEQQDQENSDIRLDGHRKATWYLGNNLRDGVRLPRL